MKTVFNSEMVGHVWAQQNQGRGRNSGGSLFFDGPTIYSYGYHFPIASFVSRDTVLMTTRTYGVTTAKHIGLARRSLSGVQVFNVQQVVPHWVYNESDERINNAPSLNLDDYAERILDLAKCARRAKSKKAWLGGRLTELVLEANGYSAFVRSERTFVVPHDMDIDVQLFKDARDAEKAAQREKLAREKAQVDIDAWINGVDVHIPFIFTETFLRLAYNLKGEEQLIETSRGATIPLEHGLRILPLIRDCARRHANLQNDGTNSAELGDRSINLRLGNFKVDSIDKDGNLRAGCHTITHAELERFATVLGV